MIREQEHAGYFARMKDKPRQAPPDQENPQDWLDGWDLCNSELKEIQAEKQKKIDRMDEHLPGWRDHKHPNGNPVWGKDGMLLNENGSRSIFDDVDE